MDEVLSTTLRNAVYDRLDYLNRLVTDGGRAVTRRAGRHRDSPANSGMAGGTAPARTRRERTLPPLLGMAAAPRLPLLSVDSRAPLPHHP